MHEGTLIIREIIRIVEIILVREDEASERGVQLKKLQKMLEEERVRLVAVTEKLKADTSIKSEQTKRILDL